MAKTNKNQKKRSFNLRFFLIGAGLSIALLIAGAFSFILVKKIAHKITVSPPPSKTEYKTLIPPDQKTATPAAETQNNPALPTPKPVGPGVPILMYHYVGNNPNPADHQRDVLEITPDKFDAQMGWLAKNGYTPITLDTLYAIFNKTASRPPKPLVLTFDDGYIDFYFNAFPILRKYGFHAVAFIPTGLIEKPAYMTWGQIKEIQNSGLVDFEGHTISHAYLPRLSPSAMLSELKDGKKALESQTGRVANFIAYPYGASDPTVWKTALEAGFVGGVGTWPGRASVPAINMPRVRINGNISLEQFERLVQ